MKVALPLVVGLAACVALAIWAGREQGAGDIAVRTSDTPK